MPYGILYICGEESQCVDVLCQEALEKSWEASHHLHREQNMSAGWGGLHVCAHGPTYPIIHPWLIHFLGSVSLV